MDRGGWQVQDGGDGGTDGHVAEAESAVGNLEAVVRRPVSVREPQKCRETQGASQLSKNVDWNTVRKDKVVVFRDTSKRGRGSSDQSTPHSDFELTEAKRKGQCLGTEGTCFLTT